MDVTGAGKNLRAHTSFSKSYMTWLLSDSLSACAQSIEGVYLSLLAFDACGSVVIAGLIVSIIAIVQRVSTFFGGAIVDAFNRKHLLILYALLQAMIWFAAFAILACGGLWLPLLLLAACISALLEGLLGGSSDALLREICDGEQYIKARSANEGRDAGIAMIGASTGGILFAFSRSLPALIMFICFALSLVAAVALAGSHAAPFEVERVDGRRPLVLLRGSVDGIKWLHESHSFVCTVLPMALLNVSFGLVQYGAQLALLQSGASPASVGILDTVVCGAAIGSSILVVSCKRCRSLKLPIALLLIGIVLGTAVTCAFEVSLGSLALFVICYAISLPMLSAVVQGKFFSNVPLELQGRARAVLIVAVQMPTSLASYAAGLLVQEAGAVALSVTAGLLAGFSTILLGRQSGAMRRNGRGEPPAIHSAASDREGF